ncbi:PP2C family protein-serine/threonine phosphatase [Butyrivibrio hungatei]|uniref:Serine/threonine protein phosphatase n=1 Tax=Butyrivibrio hungatei TaxID=185008 RepID=A0A1D9P5P9_9FIRM|nr:PP2C family serine/threonine-protein phosphatase [Butyrivibrio hungatei]AOZ97495.1 serine/threonine protein phosphatase [Butyrivibrio hungatei]
MKVKACINTDVGKKRKENQDSSLIKVANSGKLGRISFVVVCDGMGGLSKGEVASCKAVRAMESWFHEELALMQDLSDDKLMDAVERSWRRLIGKINGDIKRYGKHRGISLGTTMAALLQVGRKYILLNVGDSRIYLLSRREIKQLTQDQSVGNVLIQCVGSSKAPDPEIVRGEFKSDSTIVACSDGFWRKLEEKEIFRALCPQMCVTSEDMLDQCRSLFDMAWEREEKDNITAAALCMEF